MQIQFFKKLIIEVYPDHEVDMRYQEILEATNRNRSLRIGDKEVIFQQSLL